MAGARAHYEAGTRLDDTYELVQLIGRGGMGEVWSARHLRLAGHQVAIKILVVEAGLDAEWTTRFRREAEIVSRIKHPNIVKISDFNNSTLLTAAEAYAKYDFDLPTST